MSCDADWVWDNGGQTSRANVSSVEEPQQIHPPGILNRASSLYARAGRTLCGALASALSAMAWRRMLRSALMPVAGSDSRKLVGHHRKVTLTYCSMAMSRLLSEIEHLINT